MQKLIEKYFQDFVEIALVLVLVAIIIISAISLIDGGLREAKIRADVAPAFVRMRPTIFTCYQDGVKIVGVLTDDGADYGMFSNGAEGWQWSQGGVIHRLSRSDSITCSEFYVIE